MALIGNRSVIHKSPMHWFSGTTLSGDRNNFNTSGMVVSRFTGGVSKVFGASPSGHLPPSCWVMPMKPGGISSFTLCVGAALAFAGGAMGVNLSGNCSGECSAVAVGGLVSSANGMADGLCVVSGSLSGAADVSGSAQGACSVVAIAGALAWLSGACSGDCGASAQSSAIGAMSGSVTPFTELSPEGLAGAVWGAELPGPYPDGTAGAMVSDIGFMMKILRNKREITKTGLDWRLVVYDDDGFTPILSKVLLDVNGGAISDLSAGVLAREDGSNV